MYRIRLGPGCSAHCVSTLSVWFPQWEPADLQDVAFSVSSRQDAMKSSTGCVRLGLYFTTPQILDPDPAPATIGSDSRIISLSLTPIYAQPLAKMVHFSVGQQSTRCIWHRVCCCCWGEGCSLFFFLFCFSFLKGKRIHGLLFQKSEKPRNRIHSHL